MEPVRPSTDVVIVAAGRGTRVGGETAKQWRRLGCGRVIDHAIAAFDTHPSLRRVIAVAGEDAPGDLGVDVVPGGPTRSDSVRAGLEALASDPPRNVLIHDAARPLVSRALIDRVLDALERHTAAAPGLAVTDALWHGAGDLVDATPSREGLYRAQTPQGFRYDLLVAAHAGAPDAADDVEVMRAAGHDVRIVAGDEENLKITHPEDFERAERLMRAPPEIRVGNGFDVHRFGPGTHVMLCGVEVPHERGLQGHSDADVAMHAVTDAILGALAEGDIGRHFPPSEDRWKDAASDIFLTHAVGITHARGLAVGNLDCTIICEVPKIGPHADAMRARLAEICAIETGRVSVKATTSERLGFTGRKEGVAAMATVTLVGR